MTHPLLSSAEENSIFGFLDALDWDLDESVGAGMPAFDSGAAAGSMDVDPYFSAQRQPLQLPFNTSAPLPLDLASPHVSDGSSRTTPTPTTATTPLTRPAKPLLTQPQKRLNHIMSEQKRRNAIKEGYETLAMLLAPGDVSFKLDELTSPHRKDQAARMASEFGYTGRPGRARGSGKNGKAKKMGKGKSGMLFRAVEFCKWLQQDVDALQQEVDRLEKAFGAQCITSAASAPSRS